MKLEQMDGKKIKKGYHTSNSAHCGVIDHVTIDRGREENGKGVRRSGKGVRFLLR